MGTKEFELTPGAKSPFESSPLKIAAECIRWRCNIADLWHRLIYAIYASPQGVPVAPPQCGWRRTPVSPTPNPRLLPRFNSSMRRGEVSPTAIMSKDGSGTCARWVTPHLPRCRMISFLRPTALLGRQAALNRKLDSASGRSKGHLTG